MKEKKWTKEYEKQYAKEYRAKHKDKLRRQNIDWCKKNIEKVNLDKKKERRNLKLAVIAHYSPNVCCVKCGFSDIRALQIDHIENDGASQRKQLFGNRLYAGTIYYRWLRKNGFPEGLQVLCANCNTIKFQETL